MFFSPAKVNLYFHVLKKRSDGYHEIASLFQAIDLGDTLTIDVGGNEDRLVSTDPNLPTDGTNLILRAASLFREKTGIQDRFSFSLDKKIPIESGLGGGSSNAATTLWGLNALLNQGIDDSTLAKWGKELGADVPFFFSHGRAYCAGIGEKLTLLESDEQLSLWIAKPKVALSTPYVFQNHKINSSAEDRHYRNDLEPTAFALAPSLQEFKGALSSLGFERVLMTGSGTAFYCIGNVSKPQLPEVDFFKASFLRRDPKGWYKLT